MFLGTANINAGMITVYGNIAASMYLELKKDLNPEYSFKRFFGSR